MSIRVYVADGCPHCVSLLDDLRRRHVVFEVINLSREPARLAELVGLTWERSLPAVVDHERCSIGFAGSSSSFAEVGLSWPRRGSS